MEQAVQAVLDAACAGPDGPAGLVFGAVDRTGRVLTRNASGLEELGSGRKMKSDSVFCLYSCTKMITGIAVMQLVEQGKLELDAPVSGILPEVGNAKLVNGKAPRTQITLRHLLSHTAGFSYSFFNSDIASVATERGYDEFSGKLEGFVTPLVHEPGTDWHYGVGIDWAGELLHRVTGQTLGEYCKQHIFDPLGADDIGFGLLPKHKGRLVAMHQRAKDGKLSVREHLDFTVKGSTFDSGGAGCVGTVDDYLKIMVVLLNEGKGANGVRILKAETVKSMQEDQLEKFPEMKKDTLEVEIPAANPELTDPIQMMPGVTKGWGLTFQLLKDDLPTGRKGTSLWWAGLCNNYYAIDPKSGVAHIILSQSFPFNDLKVILPWLGAETEVYKAL